MEFFLQLDDKLQGMNQSGYGSAHEAPNEPHYFFGKAR